MEDDKCGYCGKEGSDTWLITNEKNDIYFYSYDCECEEHVECSGCGNPL